MTVGERASHALVLAAMGPAAGGKGSAEQYLARELYPRLKKDWLLITDRNWRNHRAQSDYRDVQMLGNRRTPAQVTAVRVPRWTALDLGELQLKLQLGLARLAPRRK